MRKPVVYCPRCDVELEFRADDTRGDMQFGEHTEYHQCPNCKAYCRVNLVWLLAQNKEE